MTEYEQMAQEVVAEVANSKNSTPTDVVNKMARERGLTKEAQQRLVEETNIGLFLNKMKEGTHYEDFDLASPEIVDDSSSTGSGSSLNKEASYGVPTFDASAFCLTDLPKTAKASVFPRVDINEGIYNMHIKTEKIELEKEKEEELEKVAIENATENRQHENWYCDIATKIRGDADLVKTACVYFSKSNPKLVEEVLHETNLTTDEIKDGIVSDLSISSLGKVASKENPTKSSFMRSASDTLRLLKYPLRNPKTAAGLGIGGYTLNKAIGSNKEIKERQAMMIPNND